MKKITLALLTAFSLVNTAFGQINIVIQAPSANSTTQLRAPNGLKEHRYINGVYLIKASELTALTGSIVNEVGFSLTDGAGVQIAGQMTLSLENTSDVTYNKSLNYVTATTPMAIHYNGPYTVPAGSAPTTTMFVLSTPFTYTGGGIYVAFSFSTGATFGTSTNPATYEASNVGTGNALGATIYDSVPLPSPPVMTSTDFRPAFLFKAINTATNELGVMDLVAPGKVAKLFNAPQVITSEIKNASNIQKTNMTVSLTVSGANVYNATATIPLLAAGASTVVSFTGFNPTANGINTLVVSVPTDANLSNNAFAWTQSVTCDEYAIYPGTIAAGSFTSQGWGAGASTSGIIYALEFTPATNASVTAVKIVIPGFSSAANVGKQIYPVVTDASGTILGQGNPVTITTGMTNAYSTHYLTSPVQITAGNQVFIGMALPANGYFPVGGYFPTTAVNGYYQIPTAGGAPNAIDYGYLSLSPLFTFTQTALTASATRTVVCGKKGETTVLTAVGTPTSYVWSVTGAGNSSSITVTPTLAGTATQGVVNYTVSGNDPVSGCKTNNAIVTVSITPCTGIMDNEAGASINVYPNPAVNGKVVVSGLQGTNVITVINTLGQVVSVTKSSNETAALDLSNEPSGSYMVKITNSQNESKVVKIVNQN
jgi:hypothetical protein